MSERPTDPTAPGPAVADDVLVAVAEGRHADPHSVLGLHPLPVDPHRADAASQAVIRTRRPLADTVEAVFDDGRAVPLHHLAHGIWSGVVEGAPRDYRIRASYGENEWTSDEPYRFGPSIGELDLHLIGEGRHEELWRVLGARYRSHWGVAGEVAGTAFAVWAPRARAVRVVGGFNRWDGTSHAMRSMGSAGVWELFVPDVEPGTTYKFEILTASGEWIMKADPMARQAEIAPATGSIVSSTSYEWGDGDWMAQRASTNAHERPMSVYEMHLGSWRPGRGYRDVADELIEYLGWLGYTHVEFMPLAEHPFGGSWGYQVTGYFAATSRFGSPDDLKYLIDRLHRAGYGVIMDWVPGHFPKDEWALARFDGEPLYEHPDPRRGEQKDWGTYVFDFGNPRVRNFLVANALFWLEEMHVDGLRVDAVASMLYLDYSRDEGEWEPNIHGGRENLEAIGFLQEATATAYKRNPGIVMIAEESTSFPGVTAPTSNGGLGFGYKWNMGWMHDTLQYIAKDPMYRAHHHHDLTFSFLYAFSEHFVLPISHDEVVHGKGSLIRKMPGDHWQQLANVRAYLAFMWAHPGKQLLFMGQEFGQLSEWSEERGLDWWILEQPSHKQLAEFVGALNRTYRDQAALWQLDDDSRGFEWIEGGAAQQNVVAFLRYDRDRRPLLCIVNFAGVPHERVRFGLPSTGRWREILNSDAAQWGGSGVGNLGAVEATDQPWAGRPASAEFTLPPLGAVWFTLE